MNDSEPVLTVTRPRIANMLEVLSMIAIGDLDSEKIREMVEEHDDDFGQLEKMVRVLATDLAEVLDANERYTREIEKTAAELEDKLQTIERQQLAIQDLSTPVIEIWDDVLTLPIVGIVDTKRSVDMTERLLHAIVDRQAKYVIIDITGVDMVDTATADHFVKMIRASDMLGAHCVVSGISPDVAQTLTRIGVELDGVRTLRNLKDALRHCFAHLRAANREPDASKSRSARNPENRG